jgi:hypothetical protein
MRTSRWALVAGVCALHATGEAASVSLYSGTFQGEGDHPAPVVVGKVMRGAQFEVRVLSAAALVNYPDPKSPTIIERVQTFVTGGRVSCPWFVKLDGTPGGTRISASYAEEVGHQVVCDDGTCEDLLGRPIPKSKLLFGRYDLPACMMSDGTQFGFFAKRWVDTPTKDCPAGTLCGPEIEIQDICCQEFTVEPRFSAIHYFDRLLITENFREQELTDLDVDLRKMYLTFENDRREQATCVLTDLAIGGELITVNDLRDCVLPAGDQFTMSAQSRFFFKDTRACGKFTAKGVKSGNGIVPDWFLGWFDCDGRQDRTPIMKQYTYATRVNLQLREANFGGSLL